MRKNCITIQHSNIIDKQWKLDISTFRRLSQTTSHNPQICYNQHLSPLFIQLFISLDETGIRYFPKKCFCGQINSSVLHNHFHLSATKYISERSKSINCQTNPYPFDSRFRCIQKIFPNGIFKCLCAIFERYSKNTRSHCWKRD